jgi:hypothetical protein
MAAILKSNQASVPCTVRYLDYNTSGGYGLPCTVRYLDYNTSGGYALPCTVRYLATIHQEVMGYLQLYC